MRIVAVALAALVSLPAAPAAGGSEEPAGFVCGYAVLADPAAPGRYPVEVDGGPIAAADLADAGANPVSVTLTCSLQVNAWTHAGPDAATVSGSGPVVAAVPPTIVSVEMEEWDYLVPCTQVTVVDAHGATRTYYWDDWNDEFSPDPGVECYSWCCDEPPDVIGLLNGTVFEPYVDPVVCPHFVALLPPEGDFPVWDCPPYGEA